jgi:hypothetical protein
MPGIRFHSAHVAESEAGSLVRKSPVRVQSPGVSLAACCPASVSSADSAAIGIALAQSVSPPGDTIPISVSAVAPARFRTLGRRFVESVERAGLPRFTGPLESAPQVFHATSIPST